MIGDVKTGEIARYEEGLLYQSLSRTTDGYFWGDNAVVDPRIRNLECFGTGFSDVRTPNGAREVRWRQLLGQYNGAIDAEIGKRMLADTFDTYLGYISPSARTICAHSDVDPCYDSGLTPFTPFGSVDGKVVTSADVKALSLWARCGRADGTEFDAEEFLRQRPQWDWQRGYLKDRPQRRGPTSSRAAPAGIDRACFQVPELRAGGRIRSSAVPDVQLSRSATTIRRGRWCARRRKQSPSTAMAGSGALTGSGAATG